MTNRLLQVSKVKDQLNVGHIATSPVALR